MRARVLTTLATYCLLSLAGGVSFFLPDSIEAPTLEPPVRPDPTHTPCLPACVIDHDCPVSPERDPDKLAATPGRPHEAP